MKLPGLSSRGLQFLVKLVSAYVTYMYFCMFTVGNVISCQYLLNLLTDSNKLLAHQDQYKRNVLHYAAMSGSSEVASLYSRWCPHLIVCIYYFIIHLYHITVTKI